MKPTAPNPRYRMPAEWEPHASTWLAWPHHRGDWPGKFEPIPWVYAEIIRVLARHEAVEVIVNDAAAEKLARKTLDKAHALDEKVHFHRWPTNRVWTRDSGCTFVMASEASSGGPNSAPPEPSTSRQPVRRGPVPPPARTPDASSPQASSSQARSKSGL